MGASSAGLQGTTWKASWSRVAERGSSWGMRFTLWWYRVFGHRLSLPLVYAVVTYFFLTDAPGRRASLAYLRRVRAMPGGCSALPREPGLRECYRHYRTFAVAIVDRLSIWLKDGGGIRFDTVGTDLVDAERAQGRGGLILGAHLGNFDALRRLAETSGHVVNVLMFTENARRINAVFRELHPGLEEHVIAVDPGSVNAVFAVRERLRRGEHVAILADRIELGGRGRAVGVRLLGGLAQLPEAPVLLAGLLGCPVFLMLALKSAPGHYRVIIEKLTERVDLRGQGRQAAAAELLTAYARRLEHYCLEDPYQWFNFFDYWGDASGSPVPESR